MSSLLIINDKIEKIKEEIKFFDTDERKEIKKNNKIIDGYVLELSKYMDVIFHILNDRHEELIPLESTVEEIDDDVISIVKHLSDNDFIFKMGFDNDLYEIRYSNSLDMINSNISKIINKFGLIDVILNQDDFKYSLSLYRYMCYFFDNKNKDDFNVGIKDTFDSLYWECPEIVNHIYLCFVLLLEKYKDKFENYIKLKIGTNDGYDNELDRYYKLVVNYEEKKLSNKYIIYDKFVTGELRIDDYLDNSIRKKEVISKFIDYDKYSNFSDEERKYFYEQIKGIYHDLCECLWISKFSYMIVKIKDIYLNKGNYTNNYNMLMKNLKSLNKQRVSLNNKLFGLYNKINVKNNNRLMKKYNNLFNKANNKINEIISCYGNYDEVIFINNILNKLNDDSSYYDAFKIFEGNYSFLINFMKDNDGNYDDFIEFLYNPYLSISKRLSFVSNVNIEESLSLKCDLFDIDIDLSDKNKLMDDLEYIIRLSYIDSEKINLDEFKLIFDIKKIIKE